MASQSLTTHCLATLKQLGLSPQHIVDIGAHRGGWTRDALKYFPDAHFTLVEPQEQLQQDARDLLAKPNIHWHTAGMGDKSGTMLFTLHTRDDSCSFRYPSEEAQRLGFRQVLIPVHSLDDLLRDSPLPAPGIIKIDAEGQDLRVLDGARRFLGTTEVFFVEAAVAQREFENSIAAVFSKMDGLGYRLFDVSELNRTIRSRALWLTELVFVLRGGLVDQAVQSYES
jgi:FkbM family methyltransferase